MDLFEVIRTRRSVRAYQSCTVPKEKLDAVYEAVRLAPSAGNLQAFQVYVVRDAPTRHALAQTALDQQYMAQASVVLVFCAVAERSAKYGQRGADLYCVQDATIAAAYAQLATKAVGLDSCWVGAFDEASVVRLLGLPPGQGPVVLLPIGYAAETPVPTARRPLTELIVERTARGGA